MLCIWGLWSLPFLTIAQNSVPHIDTLKVEGKDTLFLSHPFVVPFSESITLNQTVLADSQYVLDYQYAWLILLDSSLWEGDSIRVQYRYFVSPPKTKLAIRSLVIKQDSSKQEEMATVFLEEDFKAFEEGLVLDEARLRKSGSISRGLTVGNNRGAALTSGLRLQIEGDLGDGLKIVGNITDENIPIQPDGTTQEISDFDRIFIRLEKEPFKLTIGDYEINHQNTYFANFYRNVQGVMMQLNLENTDLTVSGSVAKGRFHTNSFNGQEGVAGPYRLTGKNGERFFTVLAGSEKVFLNGKLMKRGEGFDYVIDYNTAELRFTAKHVISSAHRIVIDFEYTERSYNRSLLYAQAEQRLLDDRFKIRFSYGRDADNPNAPFDDLGAFAQARDSLRLVGDDIQQASTSGIDSVGYSTTEVRYARQDTTIAGQSYERYVFSVDSTIAVFQLFFSYVGPNQGMYVRDQSGINNNVYRWSAPDSAGNPTGDYAPIRPWVLPRQLQVADLQLSYQLTKNIRLYSETALSNEDKNRLSDIDDEDNVDIANRAGLVINKLKLRDSLWLSSSLTHQYVGQSYTNIDRVYKAEYNRIWNLEGVEERRDEQIGMADIELNYKDKLKLKAEGGIRGTGVGRRNYRQVYSVQSSLAKFVQGKYSFTHLLTESPERRSRWLRHEGDLFGRIKKWQFGTVIWTEKKDETVGDSVGTGSLAFREFQPYIRTVNTKKYQIEAYVNHRYERGYLSGAVRDKFRAQTYFLRWNIRPNSTLNVQHITSYRIYRVQDSLFRTNNLNDSRSLNTNFQLDYKTRNQLLAANFVYEVASEQLARKDMLFIEVNPGQGQYEWIDVNEDSIQTIDEFQLSTNPLVANFIRIIRPTQTLFPSTQLGLSGRLRLSLHKVIEKSDKFLPEFARNIRALTTVRMSQNKEQNTRLNSYFINVSNIFADSSLLDATMNFRQDLSFYQNNPKGDIKFTYLNNQTKLFLSTGNESRLYTYYRMVNRFNFDKSKSIEWDSRIGDKISQTTSFSNRNYDIRFIETNPQANFQFSRKLRFSTGYTYKFRENTIGGDTVNAQVRMHKISFETKWNIKDRNNIFASLDLVNARQDNFTDEAPSFSADYELKDGLQAGFNAIWQVFATYYILKNVELSITYDGRANQLIPTVHTGRLQVRAFF